MADIDMPDAGPSNLAPSKASGATKTSKSGGPSDGGADGKKRFEVKKVCPLILYVMVSATADLYICSGMQ